MVSTRRRPFMRRASESKKRVPRPFVRAQGFPGAAVRSPRDTWWTQTAGRVTRRRDLRRALPGPGIPAPWPASHRARRGPAAKLRSVHALAQIGILARLAVASSKFVMSRGSIDIVQQERSPLPNPPSPIFQKKKKDVNQSLTSQLFAYIEQRQADSRT